MPTKQEWVDSLYRDYQVVVSSSSRLVSDVIARQTELRNKYPKLEMKPVLPVKMFQPDININIKPIELLLSIALISSPPVTNLADICSTWAIVRYIWAFMAQNNSSNVPALRLSPEARNIDFHQKALLSDEIGLGFANFLMVNYFGAVQPVDVSYVLQHQNTYGVKHLGKSQPDYIFFDEVSGDKYVVECKGTQTSRAESIHQLQRGTEQVLAIKPDDGKSLACLIVATSMQKQRTIVYILDPPNNESPQDSEHNREKEHLSVVGESFRRDTRLVGRAKLLTFAGLDQEASQILPVHMRRKTTSTPRPSSRIDTIKTDFGDYEGTTISVNYRDGIRLDIFTGISSYLRDSFKIITQDNKEWLSREKEPSELFHRFGNLFKEKRYLNEITQSENEASVQSMSLEGAVLKITIRE